MATAKPIGLSGVTRMPSVIYISAPQPMTLPPIPIASVATAPPGSRPGMMALASSPTTVP